MSVLELHHSGRNLLPPQKKHQIYLDASDGPLGPSLFSAASDYSLRTHNSDIPLTPTSNLFKGTYSDTSEAVSGDTVPSSVASVADETVTHSEHTIDMDRLRVKDSELDRNTVTDGRSKSPGTSSSANHPTLDPKCGLSEAPEPRSAGPLDYFSKEPENDQSSRNARTSMSVSSRRNSLQRPASVLRASTDVPRSETAASSTLRPLPAQFQSLRRLSTILRSSPKDKSSTSTEEDGRGRNTSTVESELTRTKTSFVTKTVQKKKDLLEDSTYLVGNKITEGHQNFVMAYNMLTGIRVAVSRCSGVMRPLNDNDFKATKKLSFDMDGTELTPSSKYDFKFKDYAPEVFRELRSMFGIDPADYLMSITGKYILSELGSSGKSGSFFYYSRDYRFIIKTIHHSEHKQLRRILKDYHQHVKNNPNTMVSQFYGLHRLKVNGGMKSVHFLVMNNLFPPHRDIHIKYDLKGSTWGRYTRVPTGENEDLSELTLKDLNWLERHDAIKFGPVKKKIFLEQLEADVKLLKKINVMDYSLLLGIHDVKKGNSETVANLSVFDPKSNLKAEVFNTHPRDIDRGVDLPSDVFPGRSKYIFYGHNGGIRATNENNAPVGEIYYLGIIDCLTNYSFKKRLETAWRSMCHPRTTISAVPAHEYGDRFLRFIKDGISDIKLKMQ